MKVERYYPHFAKEKQGEGMLKDRFLVLYLGSFETFWLAALCIIKINTADWSSASQSSSLAVIVGPPAQAFRQKASLNPILDQREIVATP